MTELPLLRQYLPIFGRFRPDAFSLIAMERGCPDGREARLGNPWRRLGGPVEKHLWDMDYACPDATRGFCG